MALFTYCLLVLLLKHTKSEESEECVLDRKSLNVAYDTKLKKDLLCNYNSLIPPKLNETNQIYTYFIVRSFKFDNNEEVLTMYLWADLSFKDDRLKWNPADYDGITLTRFNPYEIWTPILKHKYSTYIYGPFSFTSCDVRNDGSVNFVIRLLVETECSTKLRNWPYDTQSCTVQFGEHYKSSKVVYTYNGTKGLWTIDAEYGAGWTIIDYKAKEDNKSDIQLSLTFIFEREAVGLAAMIVIPSIIVFTLTITSLLLDVKGRIRLFIGCFNLLNHYNLIWEISEEIPKHSEETPSVLLFIRGSLILTTILVVLTFVLSYLVKTEMPTPAWITNLNGLVLKSKLNYVVWPRWSSHDNIVKISEDIGLKAAEEWMDFANIVNSFCLILFFLVYIILFSVYMPSPVSTVRNLSEMIDV